MAVAFRPVMTSRTALALACALVGCGAIEETPSSPADTTPPPAPPATATPAPSTPAVPTREGTVSINTMEVAENDVAISAWASFRDDGDGTPIPETCRLDDLNGKGPPSFEEEPPSDSAGTISLSALFGVEKYDLKLPFDPLEKRYQDYSGGADGHATGMIHVKALGDVVPAFETDLPALAPVKVIAPVADARLPAGELTVSWTYAGEDVPTIVYLMGGARSVLCAPKGRTITISASFVEQVREVATAPTLMVLTIRQKYVDAGDYRVRVKQNTSTQVPLIVE